VWLHPAWGKLLFCAADLVAGSQTRSLLLAGSASHALAERAALLSLLNPFTAAVSTRGSCDALLAVLLLACLQAAQAGRPGACGVLLGAAAHFRVYPAVHALPLALHFLPRSGSWAARARSGASALRFLLACALSFALLFALCYACCGWRFVAESYLYHAARRDGRHNFSAAFYSAYLSFGAARQPLPRLACALAQLAMVIMSGVSFSRHPGAALFFQTLLFVAFNSVQTAQYFLWWMALLPLLLPQLLAAARQSRRLGGACVAAATFWLLAQLNWLAWAARLEFSGGEGPGEALFGGDAYLPVFLSSLVFLAAQTLLACVLVRAFAAGALALDAAGEKQKHA
jgi:phosphatidylinositol glycan class M